MTDVLRPAPPAGFDRHLIPPLALGALLNPINSSLLAVALVPIGLALGAPASDTAWLVAALYVTTAVGQPVVGRLVDRHGPRPLYLLGAALVGLGGVLGALAPSIGLLIVARVVIGLGTCAGYPSAMSLIRSEQRRTGIASPSSVLAILSVTTQVVSVIGPSLGGLLIALGGWRAIFTVNVPLALACLVLGWWRLPTERPARAGDQAFDLLGTGLFAVMLVSLLLVLMAPDARHLPLLAVTVLAAAGFARRELTATAPFLDLRLLAGNGPLLRTYLRQLLFAVVSYSIVYGYPQWMEGSRGLSPSAAGLLVLPMFASAITVTALSGRRPQIRGKLVVGAVALLAGAATLLLVDDRSPMWLLVAIALLLGVPQGLNSLANQNAVYHQARADRVGSAAGLLRTAMYLGAIVSSAAAAAAYGTRASTAGLHHLVLLLLGCSALLCVVVLTDRSLRRVGNEPGPA
ncbi:MAG: MFS transporter [Cellulomonas sp.]|nr:MFS transporter [Cellulomonas sp.]